MYKHDSANDTDRIIDIKIPATDINRILWSQTEHMNIIF